LYCHFLVSPSVINHIITIAVILVNSHNGYHLARSLFHQKSKSPARSPGGRKKSKSRLFSHQQKNPPVKIL